MSDDAAVATAQDSGEIAGGGAPGSGGVGGGVGEAAIIVGEELGEESIGGLEGGDAAQPQLADEAVLQRLPEAFDAACGEPAGMNPMPSSRRMRPKCVGSWRPRSCSSTVQCGSLRTKTLRRSP